MARGEWICYLDGDDHYAQKMLTEAAQLMVENPDCDIVRVRATVFQDGNDSQSGKVWGAGLLTGAFFAGFYRRAKFGDVRFPDFIVGEDRVYAARCVFRTAKIGEGDFAGYLYRQRATSVSHVPMTVRKAQDSFLHVAEILKTAAVCGRTLVPAFRRLLVAQVLEEGAANCRRLERSGRREVERRWRTCVAELRGAGLLTPWGRFVAGVIAILPASPVVWTLCVVPHWLKRRGFNRHGAVAACASG